MAASFAMSCCDEVVARSEDEASAVVDFPAFRGARSASSGLHEVNIQKKNPAAITSNGELRLAIFARFCNQEFICFWQA
jgi:hypothetical protein